MDSMRQFLLCVFAASCVSAVIKVFFPAKSPLHKIVSLLCGLFVALSLFEPVINLDIGGWTYSIEQYRTDAGFLAEEGKMAYEKDMRSIIKGETETYILEKANTLDAEVDICVELSDQVPPIPTAVTVTGSLSPYAKTVLQEYISETLNIPKENQTWN